MRPTIQLHKDIVSKSNMAAKTNYVLFCAGFVLRAETILKMTVAMNGEDSVTRPF